MDKLESRLRRKIRTRKKVRGSQGRPRLSVCRSLRNLFIQLVDDQVGKTLVAVSTLDKDFKTKKDSGNMKGAKALGLLVAKKALSHGIQSIIFDRGGFVYHGRVKAVADGAREGGLKF